jgi:hypothetical protein
MVGVGRSWSNAVTIRLEPIALAALSLGASAIHFGVISEHYAEYPVFGLFFSGLGWFQALWAIAYVIRPVRWLAFVAIAVNLATIVIWAWAHLVGLPFGPNAGHVEPTTITDVTATVFEVVLIGGLILSWRSSRQFVGGLDPRPRGPLRVAAVVVMFIAVGVGTTLALSQGAM